MENLVISSQDAIGQSISQALTFSGVITQHTNNILQENRYVYVTVCIFCPSMDRLKLGSVASDIHLVGVVTVG